MSNTSEHSYEAVIARVRARNVGSPHRRAGTELLIRSGWVDQGPWLDADGYIDPDRMTEDYIAGYAGGAQRLLRVAASLLGGESVDLSSDLCGMDPEMNIEIIAAVAAALGHEGIAKSLQSA